MQMNIYTHIYIYGWRERERIFVWFSISSSLARTNTILKNEKSHGEDAEVKMPSGSQLNI